MEMLGAITGLIGAGLSASNNAAAQNIQWANLIFQKQQARKQERFAQAAHTDQFGNKQYYDPATNSWKIDLSPMQKAISSATEQEQFRSMTEDAERNRRQRQRQEQTSLTAADQFGKALAGYNYDQPASLDSTKDDLERLLITTTAQQMKNDQSGIARQALRMGKGADYARIIKATDDALGQKLPQAMLQARQAANQEHATELQQHEAQYMPALQNWEQLMNQGGGNAGLQYDGAPAALAATQNANAAAIQAAIQGGSSGVGGAMQALATTVGKPVDLSAVSKAFTGGDKTKQKGANYSLTLKGGSAKPFVAAPSSDNPDENRSPWDADIPWQTTGDYLNSMDYGDWLF